VDRVMCRRRVVLLSLIPSPHPEPVEGRGTKD
jgi:hypothetical protein